MTDAIVQTDNVAGYTPGKIDGCEFEVASDGAAIYRMPLWAPPFRGGMQPKLSLRYNSRSANGLVGVGWTLSGLSQITRGRKTIYDDGAEGPIRFDNTDPFYLDGERLVLVAGVQGTNNAEYRTKHDSFVKVVARDFDAAGPTLFEVFYKDGRIGTFGGVGLADLGSCFEGLAQQVSVIPVPNGTDSSVANTATYSTSAVRYAWALQGLRDRSGNGFTVQYDGFPYVVGAPPPARSFVPTLIEYGATSLPGTLRSVQFVWEDRPDVENSQMSGFTVPLDKRLAKIIMSGPNPTEASPVGFGALKTYVLSYQISGLSGRSLLAEIQEIDQFGISKGPHVFGWSAAVGGFSEPIKTGISDVKGTPVGLSPLPGRLRIADFNGDGRDDILYIPQQDNTQFYILLSDPSAPSGFSEPIPTGIPVPQYSAVSNIPLNDRVYVFPDGFDGRVTNILVLDDPPFVVGVPQLFALSSFYRSLPAALFQITTRPKTAVWRTGSGHR